jgi:hypothetical protein
MNCYGIKGNLLKWFENSQGKYHQQTNGLRKEAYHQYLQNKLIYQYQSGFLPKHSSVHQLIELYNTILNSLEKKTMLPRFL